MVSILSFITLDGDNFLVYYSTYKLISTALIVLSSATICGWVLFIRRVGTKWSRALLLAIIVCFLGISIYHLSLIIKGKPAIIITRETMTLSKLFKTETLQLSKLDRISIKEVGRRREKQLLLFTPDISTVISFTTLPCSAEEFKEFLFSFLKEYHPLLYTKLYKKELFEKNLKPTSYHEQSVDW